MRHSRILMTMGRRADVLLPVGGQMGRPEHSSHVVRSAVQFWFFPVLPAACLHSLHVANPFLDFRRLFDTSILERAISQARFERKV